MLVNDSTALACEVPVYLTDDNIRYFQEQDFHMALGEEDAPVTRHIDIL